jgi:hypothetical protein|tara:strand:- start:999 stop:1304 length:306 start_codon:yes stop_codon:yes gene_type:complete
MEIIGIILVLLFCGALLTIINLLQKLEKSEDAVDEADEYVKEMEQWITDFRLTVNDSYDQMKELDTKGAFESEDEVGSVFKGLCDVIYKLNEITNTEDETK